MDDQPVDPQASPFGADDLVCPRHPDRVSHLRCRTCGRPACPDCQRPVPQAGFDCVDCARASAGSSDPAVRPAGVNPPWQVRATDQPRYGVGGPVPDGAAPGTAIAPRRMRPVVTYVIGGLCLLVYLWQRVDPYVTVDWAFSPITGYVEPWRFLTAAFLHSPDTLSHIAFNMLSLYVMGQFLEPALGRARFVALYLLGALGGSVGCLLLTPHLEVLDQDARMAWSLPVLGASGAIFALFMAALLVLRRAGASVTGMVVLLAINAVLPLVYRNISWQAHLGGAVVGLVAAAVILTTARPGRRRWTWPALAGVAVVLVGLAVLKYAANLQALQYLTHLTAPVGVGG